MRTGRSVDVTIGAPIAVDGREMPALIADVEDFLRRHVER
jgi:hypothetical protein